MGVGGPHWNLSHETATATDYIMGSFTQLSYHVVFGTKYRKPIITEAIRQDLYEYLGGILRANGGSSIEIGGVADHVHLLVRLSPKRAISDVLRDLKANSAKWYNDKKDRQHKFEWQKGYGAFSVSYSRIEVAKRYIQNQEQHHREKSFQEEYEDFLKRHGIRYRTEYLFEDEHHG